MGQPPDLFIQGHINLLSFDSASLSNGRRLVSNILLAIHDIQRYKGRCRGFRLPPVWAGVAVLDYRQFEITVMTWIFSIIIG